jgi:hypothetical protein
VNAPAPDHNTPVLLLKPFSSPTIEDMDLSGSSGANFIVVSPFMSGWKSGESTF